MPVDVRHVRHPLRRPVVGAATLAAAIAVLAGCSHSPNTAAPDPNAASAPAAARASTTSSPSSAPTAPTAPTTVPTTAPTTVPTRVSAPTQAPVGLDASPNATTAPSSAPTTQSTPTASSSSSGSDPTTGTSRDAGAPYRLTLSALSISARVVNVSADHGTLNPPNSISEVGWWRAGAKPGSSTGAAVLVGHSAHRGGGVFDHLDQASVGDTVDVFTGGGKVQYAVTGRAIYDKSVFGQHSEEIFGQSGPGRLVLISCENWNGHEWTSNVIVYAKRV